MYKIDSSKKWTFKLDIEEFGKRIARFLSNNEKKNIVYIKNEFDNSTFRYRYYNFNQALEKSSKYLLSCFLCDEIPQILKSIDKIEIVIFQRATWDNNVQLLIDLCKKYEIPIVYDIDDLIYKYDYIPDFLNNIGLDTTVDNVRTYMGLAVGHEMVAKQCDKFICTTEYLNENLKKDFKKEVYVVPNFLNKEQLIESENIINNRIYKKEKFIVGYFSGSSSHLNDFRVCKKELIQFIKKHNNVYLKIVGFMKLDDDLLELKEKGKIIFKKLCPYQQLQYEIGEVDINIAPLYDFYFNYAKSELKYFEAAIVKIPSIVSNLGVFKSVIHNGKNGFLCDQGQWLETLERLYIDHNLKEIIAKNAYEHVIKEYTPEAYNKKIESVFEKISIH